MCIPRRNIKIKKDKTPVKKKKKKNLKKTRNCFLSFNLKLANLKCNLGAPDLH